MSTKRKTKGVIDLDDGQFNEAYDFEEKCNSRIDYMMDTSGSAFEPLVKTGVLNKGVRNIKTGYTGIRTKLKSSISILKSYKSDIESTESNYIDVVNSITIPNMYDINHFTQFSGTSYTKKTKSDGKSVTIGTLTIIKDEYDGSSSISKESLEDISDGKVVESDYDEAVKVEKKGLQSILKDIMSEQQAIYDEDTALQYSDLSKITKAGGDEYEEIDLSAMGDEGTSLKKVSLDSDYVDKLTELREQFEKKKKKTTFAKAAQEGSYDTLGKSGSGVEEMMSGEFTEVSSEPSGSAQEGTYDEIGKSGGAAQEGSYDTLGKSGSGGTAEIMATADTTEGFYTTSGEVIDEAATAAMYTELSSASAGKKSSSGKSSTKKNN